MAERRGAGVGGGGWEDVTKHINADFSCVLQPSISHLLILGASDTNQRCVSYWSPMCTC